MSAPALELRSIHKRFGTVDALAGASLAVHEGRVHALLGENGAGKSTLMRVAYGLVVPDRGAVCRRGVVVRIASPLDAIRVGIGMVHQHFSLVATLSARDNVALGVSNGRRLPPATRALAAQLGVPLEDATPVGAMPVTAQQRVEILKALARHAVVLILDEPTAALAPRDIDELMAWLDSFRRMGGCAVLVTHKLREAMAIADDVTVLRAGRVRWTGTPAEATADLLMTAMLGEHLAAPSPSGSSPSREPGLPVVVADRLTVLDARGPRVKEASLIVRQGEILGVAGVEGSGVHELLETIAGRATPASGLLRVPDEIGFVPEDRLRDALLPDDSVTANVLLRGAGRRRGWLRRAEAAREAERLVAEAAVRTPDVEAPVGTLSGGNQQRLLLARELHGPPPLVVAVNPTRGLDVAAAAAIRDRLRQAADAGIAVVFHTPDLDELVAVAHRVVVMFSGQLVEVPRDRVAIGRAMLGAA